MEIRRPDGGVVAVEVVGAPEATPVLLCHGLADSRLAARRFAAAADEFGRRVIAPDRPGTGGTSARRLDRVVDWVEDATHVLDALDIAGAQVLGVSGGGAFAAACAARSPERFPRLVLDTPLGPPEWSTNGMAPWQRRSLRLGTRVPGFGGWFLARLAALGRRAPRLFFRVVTTEMPAADRQALSREDQWQDFVAGYLEAFRQGSVGVAQDLRLLTHPWGFEPGEITVPTVIHHGDVDTTVPLAHARRFAAAIPHARLEIHPAHGHFSIPPADVLAQPDAASGT
ncbi:alpha/beta fold hydrolase [Nocardioides sp. DS6]|uniref:Alpha/beta fold hydrolase n=1 Tax=Nocardioides eburneus TaxID=3231482 RepID=A0ABV3SVM5_9ACTN